MSAGTATTAALAPHRKAPRTDEPPHQLTLVEPAPAPPELKLAIVGTLQRNGEVRISTDGRVHLVVRVLQPRDALPFVAVLSGDEASHADFERLATFMVAGAAVLLVGRGLTHRQRDGHSELVLTHCDRLCAVEVDEYLNPELDLEL